MALPPRRSKIRLLMRPCRKSAQNDLEAHFEAAAVVLRELDIVVVLEAADDQECRVRVEELLEWVTVSPTIWKCRWPVLPRSTCSSLSGVEGVGERWCRRGDAAGLRLEAVSLVGP